MNCFSQFRVGHTCRQSGEQIGQHCPLGTTGCGHCGAAHLASAQSRAAMSIKCQTFMDAIFNLRSGESEGRANVADVRSSRPRMVFIFLLNLAVQVLSAKE